MKLRYTILLLICLVTVAARHPYHVNVVEIRTNEDNTTWQLTVRVFTHEWEETLRKNDTSKVDLKNPADSLRNNAILQTYLSTHLHVLPGGKTLAWNWIGYECKQDETWCYLEADGKFYNNVKLDCDILYEHGHEQQTIVHWFVKGKRFSRRIIAPEKELLITVD